MKHYIIALLLFGVLLFGCTQFSANSAAQGSVDVSNVSETDAIGGDVSDISQDIGAVDVNDTELDQLTQ